LVGRQRVESYIKFVCQRVPGMTRDTMMNDAFWRGPMAIPFLKAQAWHEAGKAYPAPDADWIEARNRVLAGLPIAKTATAAGAVVGTTVIVDKVARKPVKAAASIGCWPSRSWWWG
jgi:hypothetical protein